MIGGLLNGDYPFAALLDSVEVESITIYYLSLFPPANIRTNIATVETPMMYILFIWFGCKRRRG